MRKKLVSAIRNTDAASRHEWLELEQVACVEVSSEAEGYPVEGALLDVGQRGWRASEPGMQTIRLLFDHPQTIRAVRAVFKEEESAHPGVRAAMAAGRNRRLEGCRPAAVEFQSAANSDRMRKYKVDLPSAGGLEISICPNISGGNTRASLESLQLSVIHIVNPPRFAM
jgi:hypothetical protein